MKEMQLWIGLENDRHKKLPVVVKRLLVISLFESIFR